MNKNLIFLPLIALLSLTACSTTKDTNINPTLNDVANWKQVSYQQVTLKNLNLNGAGNIVYTKPGGYINATADYEYHCADCSPSSINQIIVGIAGFDAQACLYNGSINGNGKANFMLKAPYQPGIYYIRFRYAQAFGCQDAIKYWWGVDKLPSAASNIGAIIVKPN